MLLAGVAAFLLTYAALHDDAESLEIALAGRDLTPGETIDASMIAHLSIPVGAAGPPPGVLPWDRATEAVDSDATVVGSVPAGAVLRVADLTTDKVERPRAMSLAVDRSRAVDGAIERGDVVDVIVFDEGAARLALVGVRVLGVSDHRGGIGRAVVLTLEVDVEGALRLAYAMSRGSVEIVRATGAVPASVGASYPEPGAGVVVSGND